MAPGADGEGVIATADGAEEVDGVAWIGAVGAVDGVGSADGGLDGPCEGDADAGADGAIEGVSEPVAGGGVAVRVGVADGADGADGVGVTSGVAGDPTGDELDPGFADPAVSIGTTATELLAGPGPSPTTMSEPPPGAPNTLCGSDEISTG